MVQKIDEKNFCEILDKFTDRLKERHEIKSLQIHEWLEDALDEFLGEDFFGTEGQCDPRGDHRDDV